MRPSVQGGLASTVFLSVAFVLGPAIDSPGVFLVGSGAALTGFAVVLFWRPVRRRRSWPSRSPLATADGPRSLALDVPLNARIVALGRTGRILPEAELYGCVADEVDRGEVDRGLWTKTFVESRGDRTQHRVRYIRERVDQIKKLRESSRPPITARAALPAVANSGVPVASKPAAAALPQRSATDAPESRPVP